MPLLFTDDELALLRFTCDLFFVEESPLFYLESEPNEPQDFEESYRSLIEKKIVDAAGFRITDAALNRLAPVTECDARVVYLAQEGEHVRERNFFLLDEIAVSLQRSAAGHLLGPDLDHDELLDHLARRLLPRRASGDRIDLQLSPIEYVGLCRLCPPVDGPIGALEITAQQARTRLGSPPTPRALEGLSPSRLSVLARANQPAQRHSDRGLIGVALWDAAISGLVDRGIVSVVDMAGDDGSPSSGFALTAAVVEALCALGTSERHTFVRYDFGEDEWFIRETTFLVVDGGLLSFNAIPGSDGQLRLQELDGDRLHDALAQAVGPLRRAEDAPKRQPFRTRRPEQLAASEEVSDTEVNLPTAFVRTEQGTISE